MKRWIRALAATTFLSMAAAPALADVAPDPCEGKEEGDACETSRGEEGVCVEGSYGGLDCSTSADEGCAVEAPGAASSAVVSAGLLTAALAALRRRRSRR